MKIVCGKCSAEVETPRGGDGRIECPSCGAVFRMPALAEGESLPHPKTFPGYRLVAIVGHGGMGTVYRAVQLSMEREVAIKVLLRKYSDVPRFVARFEREAAALARLSHPNIVGVIDRGRVEDMYYFVMEFVHGHTLRYEIKHERLTVERSIDIVMQTCDALEAAHGDGIVHRDIKPGNILIREEDDVVKVADFGIVHMLEDEQTVKGERRSRLGTAKYMAPEQRGTGQDIDPRADVYALGVTFYETLAGVLPDGKRVSDHKPGAPPTLDVIVQKAMEGDREKRFQSAADMREALRALLDSMHLDQTPPTLVNAPLPAKAAVCYACGAGAGLQALVCPSCKAQLNEPCYREECRGVNPVGAARCVVCGGHLELLKRQCRTTLESHLIKAERELGAGRVQVAMAHYRAVIADPHAEYESLRERARAALAPLKASQARARLRRVFRAVGVLLVLALLGAGGYFGVTEGIPRLRAHLASATPEPVDDDEPDPEPEPDEPAPPTPPPPAPAEPRRDVLRDYLVAITGDAWTARPVRERLYMAAEAGRVATTGKATAKTAQRLAGALDAERAVAIDNNTLHESVLRGLDGVRKAVEVDLRRHKALGQRLEGLRRWHGKASASGAPLLKRLVLSSAVFYQLTVTAEAGLEPKMGLEARLLLLDGALSPIAKSDDLGRIADRVCRGGSLFVRYLRRSRKGGVLDELVDDAARRIAAARRTADSLPRLALAMEGVVEALVACKGN